MHHRNRRNVHRIPRRRFVSPNPALAQNHVVVPARHDVLARQQQLLNRGRNPPLQQNRLPHLPQFPQQVEVLHIPRAHLEQIRVRQHRLDLRDLHHLGYRQQPMGLRRLAHQFEARNPHPLKRVRRTARLERASAQKAGARSLHPRRRLEHLLAVLNRARPSHHGNFFAAHRHAVRKLHHRAFGPKGPPGQLVRRTDPVHIQHARQQLKLPQIHVRRGSHACQNRLGRSRRSVYVNSRFHHRRNHCVDLIFGGLLLHRYNHCLFPVSGVVAPVPWPGVCAWACLSEANSSCCRARITSMMRS